MSFEPDDLPVYLFVSVIGLVYLVRLARMIATGRYLAGGEFYLRAERPVDYWFEAVAYAVIVWWACWCAFAVATNDGSRVPAGATLLLLAMMPMLIVRALVTGVVSTPRSHFRRTERPGLYWFLILLLTGAGAGMIALQFVP